MDRAERSVSRENVCSIPRIFKVKMEEEMSIKQYITAATIALRNIFLGGNLASFFLIKQPRELVNYVSENLFLLKTWVGRGVPEKSIFELFSPDYKSVNIQIGRKTENPWFGRCASYTTDIVSLCMLCHIFKPDIVFEIGTLRGYTALHFALNTPDNARVFTLDLPSDSIRGVLRTTAMDDNIATMRNKKYFFEGNDVAKKIKCLFGDSATFDFSPYYGKVNLFFIDGAHSYEYVKSDTMNALKCCREGSVIAWHDFGRAGVNGVSKWVKEMNRTHKIYSVPGGSLAYTVL